MREYNNVKLRLLYITLFPETTKYKTLKSTEKSTFLRTALLLYLALFTIILSYSDPTPIWLFRERKMNHIDTNSATKVDKES